MSNNLLRPIAIHLPQFHPIPENDKSWGKGFTEWSNVVKAKPLFEGHYQPHLPADLGFYDLRVPETRQAQADLAREYGIYGFCYYHYWFSGKRVLERPVEEILHSGTPDFPFMLCWANENWTRKWDGGSKEIILKQEYSSQDDLEHIKYLIPFFKDPRYIRVNGRPVFSIYRSSLMPAIHETIKLWKEECRKEGIDLYLSRFETFGDLGKASMEGGFDAGVEFQPMSNSLSEYRDRVYIKKVKEFKYRLRYHYFRLTMRREKIKEMKYKLANYIDYNDYVDFLMKNYQHELDYTFFPGVTPSWDNSARNKLDPFIMLNPSPEKFKEWFQFHVRNFKPKSEEENFIFINAWNEWAEGNHLEPCQKWGRNYLEAIKECLL